MSHALLHALSHTVLETLKALPLLYLVYLLMGWLEARSNAVERLANLPRGLGIVAGAVAGCLPQCGFAAAASSLYAGRILSGAALVAVFLATSDEAVPVLLAHPESMGLALGLILVKLVIAIAMGFLLRCTVFRKEHLIWNEPEDEDAEIEFQLEGACGCCDGPLWRSALVRTLKLAGFLAAVMFIITLAVELIGEERLSTLLLSGNVLQPLLCAVIGLIPSCAPSVVLAELMMNGSITFGSAVAGLCAGAGFGYLVLLRRAPAKKAGLVILCTFLCSLLCGTVIHLFQLFV